MRRAILFTKHSVCFPAASCNVRSLLHRLERFHSPPLSQHLHFSTRASGSHRLDDQFPAMEEDASRDEDHYDSEIHQDEDEDDEPFTGSTHSSGNFSRPRVGQGGDRHSGSDRGQKHTFDVDRGSNSEFLPRGSRAPRAEQVHGSETKGRLVNRQYRFANHGRRESGNAAGGGHAAENGFRKKDSASTQVKRKKKHVYFVQAELEPDAYVNYNELPMQHQKYFDCHYTTHDRHTLESQPQSQASQSSQPQQKLQSEPEQPKQHEAPQKRRAQVGQSQDDDDKEAYHKRMVAQMQASQHQIAPRPSGDQGSPPNPSSRHDHRTQHSNAVVKCGYCSLPGHAIGLCPIRRAKEEPSRPKPRSNHEEKDAAVAKVPLRKERSDFFSFLREEGTDRRAGEGAVAHGGDRNQGEMDKGGNQTLMMEVRLNKRMSELGLCSRREADVYIERGDVMVNGEVVRAPGTKVKEDTVVTLSPSALAQQSNKLTVLINKPVGLVSSNPEHGHTPAIRHITREWWFNESSDQRKNWCPFERAWPRRWNQGMAPLGRLDHDSEGLLLFSHDGILAKSLIGEGSNVEKEYLVRVSSFSPNPDVDFLIDERVAWLREGLHLDGSALLPAKVKVLSRDTFKVSLKEGKKRQIRRMCEQVGLQVTGLRRLRIGGLYLGDLSPGNWRFLHPSELGDISAPVEAEY